MSPAMGRHARLALTAMAIAAACGTAALGARRDPRVESLVTDAMTIPTEFASDALLRIAGSGLVTDPEWRREILETAYMRAYAAQEPYRRTSVGIPPDSRQGAMTIAAESTLNRVSLQVRASQLLAADFPARARELFEWIDVNPDPATCDDPLVPALDEYYAALSSLARTTFDRAHRAEAMQFLELYLWHARLPSDMPSVARALQRFRPTEGEAAHLENAFRFILDLGANDARGFSTATLDIVLRAGELQAADHELGVPGWFVMEGLRAYLVRQLGAPRCLDSITESLTPAAFNDTMRQLDPFADVKPIDGREIRPSKYLGVARVDPYWRTPEARRLHDMLIDLRGSENGPPKPLKDRQVDEWRHRAERLIVDIDHWTGRSEATERDAFYQKAMLFTSVLDLMPASETRSMGLRTFVDFLRHADIDRTHRNLWYVFAARLASTRGDMRKEALTAMERSGHPILSLYSRIEQIAPTGGRRRDGGME
jgi:hypothetical protein